MNKKMCYYYNRRSRDEKELPSVINSKWTTEQPRHNNHRKNFPAVDFLCPDLHLCARNGMGIFAFREGIRFLGLLAEG